MLMQLSINCRIRLLLIMLLSAVGGDAFITCAQRDVIGYNNFASFATLW